MAIPLKLPCHDMLPRQIRQSSKPTFATTVKILPNTPQDFNEDFSDDSVSFLKYFRPVRKSNQSIPQ